MKNLLLLLPFVLFFTNAIAQGWTAQTTGTSADLVYIKFIDSTHGWAFGAGGVVLKTSNGGTSWRDVSASTDFDTRSAYAFDTNMAVAVGEYSNGDGFILRTTDGGANWTTITSSLDERLLGVYFSGDKGWAVGRKGEFYFSSDKGATWNSQNSSAGEDLETVFAVSPSTAWKAGEDGEIFRTSNSGSSWSSQNSGTGRDIFTIFFIDQNVGWAGVENGTLLNTTNGGSTWSSSSPASSDILAIEFVNNSRGWIAGEAGMLYTTTDSGNTWTAETAASGIISSLSFISPTRGWLAASGGAIYKFETVSPLSADFSSSAPACVGASVDFTDNSTGSPVEWEWNFGDGATSISQNPSHAYATSGQFEVTLTVTDAQQNEASVKKTIEITAGPTADFIASDSALCLGDSVSFTSVSSKDVVSHSWNFGDGSPTGSGTDPGHLYTRGGNFEVALIVANADGCTDTALTSISIEDLSVSVNPANVTLCAAGDSVLITASGADNYVWSPAASVRSPNSPSTYVFPGATTVYSVIGSGNSGCRDTAYSVVTIHSSEPPVADFELNATQGCVPFTVSATNLSTSATGYQWLLTGSSSQKNSALENPDFLISSPGLYTIMLVAFGCGEDDTLIKPQHIRGEQTPVAAFTISSDTLDLKFTSSVTFTNQSTQTVQPSWSWDFGNGATASLESPVATYSTPGNYNVQLVVASSNGCRDTASRPLKVIDTTPQFVSEANDGGGFALYPVPARDQIWVQVPKGENIVYSLHVYGLDGRERAIFNNLMPGLQSIQLAGLKKGLYLYCIKSTDNQVFNGKLVIK
ncbi:MAG: PKD domain-containing protein [Bacteroidia bacterium]